MRYDLIRPAITIMPCTYSTVRRDRLEGIYNLKDLDSTSATANLREGKYGGLQLSGIWRRNYYMEQHLLVLGNFRQVSLNWPCRKGPLCCLRTCVSYPDGLASEVKT